MIQFSGHFDGRVITPDERVDIRGDAGDRERRVVEHLIAGHS